MHRIRTARTRRVLLLQRGRRARQHTRRTTLRQGNAGQVTVNSQSPTSGRRFAQDLNLGAASRRRCPSRSASETSGKTKDTTAFDACSSAATERWKSSSFFEQRREGNEREQPTGETHRVVQRISIVHLDRMRHRGGSGTETSSIPPASPPSS